MRRFVNEIYKTTSNFPSNELFGLTQHIRRSAISILSNISEGTSRMGKSDFKRFIQLALGSLYETISQLFISLDNKYLTKDAFNNLYTDGEIIAKMLSKLAVSR